MRSTKQHHLATKVADYPGYMRGVETVKLEAATCGSGAAAVRQGCSAIAGGMMDAVLVVGVEKMTRKAGRRRALTAGRCRLPIIGA